MQPHLAHAGRHVARLATQWFLVLSALGSVLAASGVAAEPPPTYVTEWSLTVSPTLRTVPNGATVDGQGNLYVTQSNPQRVSIFSPTGTLLFAWEILNGGCAAYPYGVTVDAAGNTYVTDYPCSRAQKFGADHLLVSFWGGLGSVDGKFAFPTGIALDGDGNLLVADGNNHRIQKFGPAGNFLSKWGTPGSAPGQFNVPTAVAVAEDGEVFVLDSYNQRVQVFDSAAGFLRTWGEPGFGPDALILPGGMALDADKNVYVADTGNNRIMKYDSQGTLLTSWGTNGRGPGQFSQPYGVAVDATGAVYVVDSGNARIQKFAPPVEVILVVEPRTINAQAGGRWILAHIEPPAPYTPADIDVGSLRLNGVAVDPEAPVDIGDWDGNGKDDLTVRFSRAQIVATATPGSEVLHLSLTGTIAGQSLGGTDTVKLVNATTALEIDRTAIAFSGSGAAAPQFAIRGVTPNPAIAGRGLTLSLTLAGAAPATVEVLDLSGRRMLREDLAGLGAGAHQVRLGGTRPLTPGVYWVRVVQGEDSRQARFAVVR